MSQSRLRFLESELCSARETANLVGANLTRIWYWRRGANLLDSQQLAKIEAHVVAKLNSLNRVVPEGAVSSNAA